MVFMSNFSELESTMVNLQNLLSLTRIKVNKANSLIKDCEDEVTKTDLELRKDGAYG